MSQVALPTFAALSKIGPDFSGFKIELPKNYIKTKCASKFLFFNEKKIRKIWMIFDIENSLWKFNFGTC